MDTSRNRFHYLNMREATDKIKDFLQFIALQFIKHPDQAQLRVAESSKDEGKDEDRISFRLIVAKEDVPMLIGRNGFTVSAIRNVMKAAAAKHGIEVSLHIHSHEEEQQRIAEIEARQIIADKSDA